MKDPERSNYNNIRLIIFGFDLSNYTIWSQFLVCVCGVFFFHVLHGIAIERVFRFEGFNFGWFFTTVQFLLYALFAQLSQKVNNGPVLASRPALVWKSWILAGTMVFTTGLSNYALQFVSYPFQQLLKSGKLIPVVIGSKLMFKKSYSNLEYFSVLLITFGLGLLAFEKSSNDASLQTSQSQSDNQNFGLFLLTISMGFDSFVGNYQEKLMKDFHLTQEHLIFTSFRFGSILLLLLSTISGEILPAIYFCISAPLVVFWIFMFSVSGYIGTVFVLSLLRIFDSFIVATVTSTRKVLSISLSFLFFPKPLSLNFCLSALLVFWGLGVHIYSKNKRTVHEFLGFEKPLLVPRLISVV